MARARRRAEARDSRGDFGDGVFEAAVLAAGVGVGLLLWRGEGAALAVFLLPLWLLAPLALWRVSQRLARRARGVVVTAGVLTLLGLPLALFWFRAFLLGFVS